MASKVLEFLRYAILAIAAAPLLTALTALIILFLGITTLLIVITCFPLSVLTLLFGKRPQPTLMFHFLMHQVKEKVDGGITWLKKFVK